MDNATRAARLAEIFGWKIEDECVYGMPWCDEMPVWCMFNPDSPLTLWLLRELPKRGYEVEMFNRIGFGFWTVLIKKPGVFWPGKDADPLIALVDAVIAAHAERQEA